MPTSPTAITALPPAPDPTSSSSTFDAAAYTWSTALDDFVTDTNAQAVTTYNNAVEANADAAATAADRVQTGLDAVATAADRVQTGADRVQTGLDAASAEASAIAASKLNLGNKASAPTLDNQGAALLAGATYYDTTLGKWLVWSGSAWTEGISAIAGVSTVNGASGAVTIFVPPYFVLQGVI
jgi:hypothetical protein